MHKQTPQGRRRTLLFAAIQSQVTHTTSSTQVRSQKASSIASAGPLPSVQQAGHDTSALPCTKTMVVIFTPRHVYKRRMNYGILFVTDEEKYFEKSTCFQFHFFSSRRFLYPPGTRSSTASSYLILPCVALDRSGRHL